MEICDLRSQIPSVAQRVFTGAKGGGESTGHRGGRGELVNGEQRHTEEMELGEGGLQR